MSIEKRIGRVDVGGEQKVNTDYRAAIHKKFSEKEPNPDAIRQLMNEDFVLPLDARLTKKLAAIHEDLYSVFPARELITLSPIGVSGLDQYLTRTSPFKIAHTTGKPADVVADPTIQLAAEVYRRRQTKDNQELSLGTSHMCTRLQKYADRMLKPTFEMFGTLDSAVTPTDEFEMEKITDLIRGYRDLFKLLSTEGNVSVVISNLKIAMKLIGEEDSAATPEAKQISIQGKLPPALRGIIPLKSIEDPETVGSTRDIALMMDLSKKIDVGDGSNVGLQFDRVDGLGHYSGLCFSINIGDVNVADGGAVDWVSKLTSNRKERTVVSGLGTQLLAGLPVVAQ